MSQTLIFVYTKEQINLAEVFVQFMTGKMKIPGVTIQCAAERQVRSRKEWQQKDLKRSSFLFIYFPAQTIICLPYNRFAGTQQSVCVFVCRQLLIGPHVHIKQLFVRNMMLYVKFCKVVAKISNADLLSQSWHTMQIVNSTEIYRYPHAHGHLVGGTEG